jgi:hypothetical protein
MEIPIGRERADAIVIGIASIATCPGTCDA